jgi:L-alanine-DL-glutamate epimerase-like enolase superfamily enzyme
MSDTRIVAVKAVLLSGAYASADSGEAQGHFQMPAYKTTGLVEIRLEDGTVGLGEGYLAVFAPRVFEALVDLLGRELLGRDGADIRARVRDLEVASSYWSRDGAARHAVSAFEIALLDARGKQLGVPAYQLLGGARHDRIPLYASGGDATNLEALAAELDRVADLGIDVWKIRSRANEIDRTVSALRLAGEKGIRVGVDASQNLEDPAQGPTEVVEFVSRVHELSGERILFLEETLGVHDLAGFRLLRQKLDVLICGGETTTSPGDMIEIIEAGCFDFVQPDATVIGGMWGVLEVASYARRRGCGVAVHTWGGAASIMANYHAGFAAGCRWLEYPMLAYPLRDEMLAEPLRISDGKLLPPTLPGIGVRMTDSILERHPFREDAVYQCASRPISDWSV